MRIYKKRHFIPQSEIYIPQLVGGGAGNRTPDSADMSRVL